MKAYSLIELWIMNGYSLPFKARAVRDVPKSSRRKLNLPKREIIEVFALEHLDLNADFVARWDHKLSVLCLHIDSSIKRWELT